MNLDRKLFVRFPSSAKEYGPYEIAKVTPSAGAVCRFEGDDNWQPLESVLGAWDTQPASETQRQRLRKRHVEFDEQTITRRQARELYRNIPERKAQRDQHGAEIRESRLAAVRKKFPIPNDIPDEELAMLESASPPSNAALSKLAKLTAIFRKLGYELTAPKYYTEQVVSDAIDALDLCDYTHRNLRKELMDMAETGELSREPTIVEVEKTCAIIFESIMNESWPDTLNAKAKILCSVAPDIVFTDYGAEMTGGPDK